MIDSSPLLPSSSSLDPAIHLHSEIDALQEPHPLSLSHSDEFEALQLQAAEITAQKNKLGVVIQHRAWNIPEVFRSEEDHGIDTPVRKSNLTNTSLEVVAFQSELYVPSSPPTLAMPMISSPVAYPPSSSPNLGSPKKRKRTEGIRSPLKNVNSNQPTRTVGAFLDESDDEDDLAAFKAATAKRRALASIKDTVVLPDPVVEYTPPASQEETDVDPATVPLSALDDLLRTPSPVKPTQHAQHKPGKKLLKVVTASGSSTFIAPKMKSAAVSYEQLIASRSVVEPGRARKSYYGIDIHQLMDDAARNEEIRKAELEHRHETAETIEVSAEQTKTGKSQRTLMWTEKYRAKKFTDLVGDERTHRSVLKWLKGWDPIVFPGSSKPKVKPAKQGQDDAQEQKHRKILLLTGPPGLGKTTLAHVCARQAGYEVQEINASDERSRDVVKGPIRDMVGTENVKGVNASTANGKVRKAGKPVCVVVDEVDGVVGGSGGGGEGGFIKALIDLINLDEKNSRFKGSQTAAAPKKKRKGDNFRLLRPLVLICNDVYHPSLRPLRQASLAEIIHIRKPPLNMVVTRMHSIFEKEGIPCDSDGVRRLCEATWGVSTKKEGGTGSGTGEGDIRGVMVVGEWVAGKLRATMNSAPGTLRLTRRWIEENILNDLAHGGGAARSLGRGGPKEVVERIFKEGAGFPKTGELTERQAGHLDTKGPIGVAEANKRRAMDRLREMVDTNGDCDRIVTDCFTSYPSQPFQDDTLLSKPRSAYEWLHFHDTLSSAVHGSQEWELFPYLSQSVLAFHDLFASPKNLTRSNNTATEASEEISHPFSGPSAPYAASELQKANRSQLVSLQSMLSLPLTRIFRSPEEITMELLPYALRMLSPDVKPVIVNSGSAANKTGATASVRKASEKALVKRAVDAMAATGVRFERSRVEMDDLNARNGGWVFRMEPPLDSLGAFETFTGRKEDKVRFAVRQVLEMEWKRESAKMDAEARKRRGGQVDGEVEEEVNVEEVDAKKGIEKEKGVQRDFFGRVIVTQPAAPTNGELAKKKKKSEKKADEEGRVWVSFHEGFSNAVRKPITLEELMRGL